MNDANGRAAGGNWSARGQSHLASGNLVEAVNCFQRAADLEPSVALHWARLAKVHAALRDHDAAEAGFMRACMLQPNVAKFQVLLGTVLREQNKPGEALEAFARASVIDPDNLHAAIGGALMLPPIYASVDDLALWRTRYTDGLNALHPRLARYRSRPRQVLDLEWNNFYLAYQGKDDRELQTHYSDFIAALLEPALPGFQQPVLASPRPDGRIAIAFVSSDFRICTVGDYFLRWVTDLPRDRFHVSVLYTGHLTDARTAEFQHGADEFARFSGDAGSIAAAIRNRRADAIVFPDVGMSALSTILSNLRLAPVQFAAWGHPVTTGSRFIDGYLSCAAMEPDDAQAQYREPLVLLPGIGVCYRAPERIPAPGMRERLGLAADAHVYLCPQSLYKIHPETDALLLDVIEQDPLGVLLFFAAPTRGQTNAFVRRLSAGMQQRAMPARHQVKVLPPLPRANFLEVMAACDVMLDTLHWSGGNTSLDALAADLPIVTVPGDYMRGRQTSAMLNIIGLPDLVVRDRKAYVGLAIRLARDGAYRADVVARLREGKPRLFDQLEPVAALAEAIARLCAGAR